MPYVTLPLSPVYRQITFEEIIAGEIDISRPVYNNETNTRTKWFYRAPLSLREMAAPYIESMIENLEKFNSAYENLFEVDRSSLYDSFSIPKKTGGLRRIDAPMPELMMALRNLKTILESNGVNPGYHTSAFAYVPKRSTIDAVRRHQRNESWWFLKIDFSNFFGSTTIDFVRNMLRQIYPFSTVMSSERGENALMRAIELCFLNEGLPQGTPISPMLTNLIMIPVDYKITKMLNDREETRFVYTRYADDIIISGKYQFDYENVISEIRKILDEVGAPYVIKPEKTRYGSRAGSNWNLGLMLNKDNQITIGYKKKHRLRAMLFNYIADRKNGVMWNIEDIYTMRGQLSYYTMVEPEYVKQTIEYANKKYGTDVMYCIKEDLN